MYVIIYIPIKKVIKLTPLQGKLCYLYYKMYLISYIAEINVIMIT